jgi:hypothetical protein
VDIFAVVVGSLCLEAVQLAVVVGSLCLELVQLAVDIEHLCKLCFELVHKGQPRVELAC